MEALISETFQDGYYVSQFKHKKSVLEVVRDMSGEDFEVVLGLAGAAFRSLKDSAHSVSYADALAKEVAKVRAATAAAANSAACTLEGDLRTEFRIKETEYKRGLQAKEAEATDLRRELDKVKGLAAAAEASLQAARGQIGEADRLAWEKYSAIISDAKAQHEKIVAQKEASYKEEIRERIAQSEAQHAASFKEIKELYTKEAERLRKENDKALVSSEKGKTGEKEFDELCAEHTGWGPLLNTSKETAAADRRVTIRGCISLFELKNYTDIVSTEQVNKFLRDMAHNKEAALGVFISLHTNIAKKGDRYIHVEWSDDSQMLIYVNSFYTHPVADTLAFIDSCVGTALRVYKASRLEDGSALQSRIDLAKDLIQRELLRMSGIMSSLKQNNTAVVDLLTKQYVAMNLEMNSTKESLRAMLEALLGREEPQDSSSLETVIPKKRGKKEVK
jgi:hypothetical protein